MLRSSILFFFGLAASLAFAQTRPLNEEQLFYRCYTQLAGKRPSRQNALLVGVRNGGQTALEACGSLLDSVVLNATTGLVDSSTTEKLDVLNTLHRFHSGWFSVRDFEAFDVSSNVARVLDVGESGLYVTKILFDADTKYEQLLKYSQVPMAIRQTHRAMPRVQGNNTISTITSNDAASRLVQEGTLRGVTWRTNAHALKIADIIDAGMYDDIKATLGASPHNTQSSAQHLGNGVIGLPSYFIMNYGHTLTQNAVTRHARRWSKNLISDLLCRDVPVLRFEDIQTRHVQPASQIAYRKSSSCMRCHATIDPMADVARNWEIFEAPSTLNNNNILTHVFVHTPLAENLDPMTISAADGEWSFFRTRPTGNLYMRSFDGKLIETPLNNPTALASQLVANDDLYVCAARRYFEYFTGIKVSLQDIGDVNQPTMTPSERHYRKLVETLGLNFKQHQNMRRLIKEIWELPLYRNASLRDEKED